MTVLSLGISVAYKTFTGGSSGLIINTADYIGNTSYYGMFAPPGLQSLGEQTGISPFSNATLPFLVAASPTNGIEPALPLDTTVYGFNILLLDNQATAMLEYSAARLHLHGTEVTGTRRVVDIDRTDRRKPLPN